MLLWLSNGLWLAELAGEFQDFGVSPSEWWGFEGGVS